jgi:hypothetical protein
MQALADSAPGQGPYRVHLVGGSTAVLAGWRPASIAADLHSDDEEIFRDIQQIKERLDVNVEFARPEQFVPELPGSADRHVFVEAIGPVRFYHHDPYVQALSKVVRGFARDVEDARHFVDSGMVDPEVLRGLVDRIPEAAYARYPALSPASVRAAVAAFLEEGA